MPKEAHWELKQVDQTLVDDLAAELNLSQLTAEVLARRGFTSSVEVEEFLQFTVEDLHDPYLLADIKPAVERIYQAITRQEKIVIYGDYDVDGITSTALLVDYIQRLGGNVDYYIPNRLEEGYGLNQAAVKELATQGAQLMITVDCGIKAQAEIKQAQQLGLEVIVTDHHTPPVERTSALAVINPQQENCSYPWEQLCGVGVAFKLAQALAYKSEQQTSKPPLVSYLGLVTLGTIADIVPLQGENRIMTSCGLDQLNQVQTNQHPGLAALINVAGFKDKEIKAGNVGYQLAPRLNAAGRLGEPEIGVKLLLADDYFTAQEFANQLNQLNNQRKKISDRIFAEAEEAIRGFDLAEEWVLVLASPNWHSGVIGNVASDLQEKYHRPVVLIALDEAERGPGSCRSITQFNIYQALKECSDLLISFGGHKQAAGFSIEEADIDNLRHRLNQLAKQVMTKEDLRPWERVDSEVVLEELSFSILEELEALAPFGYKNPRPVLKIEDADIDSFRLVGQNNDHLKLVVSQQGHQLEGIGFGQADYEAQLQLQQENIDLLFQLDRNEWRGQVNLQLRLKDLKIPNQSFRQRLFNRSLSKEVEESEYDWFYFPLPAEGCNLEVGQKLQLKPGSKGVKLVAEHQEIGELETEFTAQLRAYLDLGIEYQAIVAKIKETEMDVFITRDFSSLQPQLASKAGLNDREIIAQIEEELLTTSLSEAEQKLIEQLISDDQVVEVNSLFNRLPVVKAVCSWQAIGRQQLTIMVLPVKHLAASYYQTLQRSLAQWGVNCQLGTSDLSLHQEADLKRALVQEEIDVLLATPEFIAQYQSFMSRPGLLIQGVDVKFREPLDKLNPVRKLKFTKVPAEQKNSESIVSLTSKASVQLSDQRHSADKFDYLSTLVANRNKVLIYVTDSKLSRKLAAKLDTPRQKMLFYTPKLSLAEQQKIINQFRTTNLTGLVATTDLLVEGVDLTDLVFYQPGFSYYQFIHQLGQLTGPMNDQLQVHLLYNQVDIEKNKQLVVKGAPDRKLLKELYILLSKLNKGQPEISIAGQELFQLWRRRSKQLVEKKTLNAMLGIFAELGLITRVKELERRIKLLPRPDTKLDLTDSMRYNECVKEKQKFDYFTSSILTAAKKEILNSIYGERRGK